MTRQPWHGYPRLKDFNFRRLVRSVKFRLTLWSVAVLGLVLVAFGLIIYFILTTSLRSGLDELLNARAAQITAAYNLNQGSFKLDEQGESGQESPAEGEIIVLLDLKGKVIERFGRISDTEIARLTNLVAGTENKDAYRDYKLSFETTRGDSFYHDYRLYYTPFIKDNQQVGTIIVGGSQENLEKTLHLLLLVLLLVAPVTLLLVAIGGYWLAIRAMRPVRAITRAAREISETDLSRRLNLGGEDELSEMAATFDQMLGRLEEAFRRQRQFTTDVSHELRTPLSILKLEANRALIRNSTRGEYRQALSIIQGEVEHMTHLVSDLLTLARADAGQVNLRLEELDLSDLALEVVERLKPLARQKGLELTNGNLPELEIVGDRLYLIQMLTNLIDNAIKYSSGGTENCRVLVETGYATKPSDKTQWAWVRVEDPGPGIPEEHLGYVFNRFYRVDRARYSSPEPLEASVSDLSDTSLVQDLEEPDGSGLGLSIVQWVAQSHGGEAKVESRVGSGTVFEVWLPLSLSHYADF